MEVRGTRDPELFSRERYGRFDYAIPVDKGTYRLSLYFAEDYFGPGGTLGGQPGPRVFDVSCNGVALVREFDLLKEAGLGQAVVKTFHGLTPNGQGTFIGIVLSDPRLRLAICDGSNRRIELSGARG